MNMDPPAHIGQRRAAQRAFTPRLVERAKPDIETIANELIDGLVDRGGCDLMKDFAIQLTVRVVGAMMALPPDVIPGFLTWLSDVFAVLAPRDMKPEDVSIPDDQLVATFERLHAAYLVYMELLEERRANPGEDLASAMLAATDDNGQPVLSTDQVLAHMVGITAAGTDTTAATITNTVRYLTQYPDQLQTVREDPSLWENAAQEGLRRSSAVMHIRRIATRQTELADLTIPERGNVCVALVAANTDPATFPDPLRFDVRRANARDHLALGSGRHYCLGAPLAPPEIRIALEVLYQRLPNLRADLDQDLEFFPSPVARVMLSQRVTW